ncbi:MAG: beta-N-acetylhexosaminidase [Pseudomonadota bacterium]
MPDRVLPAMKLNLIVGLSGPELTPDEQAFLLARQPAGVILFRRNIDTQDQVRRLTDAVTNLLGKDSLILIDEEGGRVQRLRPPAGRALPPAAAYGRLFQQNPKAACHTASLISQLTAHDLRALGINTNCAPVADLRFPGAHDIVGDRAYGDDVKTVTRLAEVVASGLGKGGVIPILKHIPGHGRAQCDSHLALPVVDVEPEVLSDTDFAPFSALIRWPAAMTAHVVYTRIDPHAPATVSPIVIQQIIRGEIGFGGLLLTDDLSMKALSGTIAERAAAALKAGCDIALHCNGRLDEMEAVANICEPLTDTALHRFETALAITAEASEFDRGAALAQLEELLHQEGTFEPTAGHDPTA